MPNVTVLPVPDLACSQSSSVQARHEAQAAQHACTIRSAPKRPSGTALCCTGDGCEKPALCRLRTSSGCWSGECAGNNATDSAAHRKQQVRKRCRGALNVGGHQPLLPFAFARHLWHARRRAAAVTGWAVPNELRRTIFVREPHRQPLPPT